MEKISLPHNHGEGIENITAHIPKDKDFLPLAEIFKLFGDASRIKIFWLLCHTEQCVINISAIMKMSSPAVSHHLKLLKTYGLIESRRDGKEVYYKASSDEKSRILHAIIEELSSAYCPFKEETK